MRMQFYTLEKQDIEPLRQYIPSNTADRTGEEGYFTLGAVCFTEEEAKLMGMAQFYVDSAADSDCYAELVYVYVTEEYRRQSVGARMVSKADAILSAEGVGVFMTRFSPDDENRPAGELPGDEKEEFLKECGFIATKEDIAGKSGTAGYAPKEKRFFRFTGR